VNVNRKLTSDQCSQFASGNEARSANAVQNDMTKTSQPQADSSKATGSSAQSSDDPITRSSDPKQVKIGDQDYLMLEQRSDNSTLRTYHTYQSGACYEFVLGLKTNDGSDQAASADANGSDAKTAQIKPVSEKQVFSRLEKILATVSISPDADQNGSAVAAAPATSEVPPQKP
jgi:hypothetical protein